MEIKFTIPGPPKGKQRPRICRVNGRSMAYTPKGTIEYEKLVRASYTAVSKAKFERNLPLEISILVLEVRFLEAKCWRECTKLCESFYGRFCKMLAVYLKFDRSLLMRI